MRNLNWIPFLFLPMSYTNSTQLMLDVPINLNSNNPLMNGALNLGSDLGNWEKPRALTPYSILVATSVSFFGNGVVGSRDKGLVICHFKRSGETANKPLFSSCSGSLDCTRSRASRVPIPYPSPTPSTNRVQATQLIRMEDRFYFHQELATSTV